MADSITPAPETDNTARLAWIYMILAGDHTLRRKDDTWEVLQMHDSGPSQRRGNALGGVPVNLGLIQAGIDHGVGMAMRIAPDLMSIPPGPPGALYHEMILCFFSPLSSFWLVHPRIPEMLHSSWGTAQ